MFGTNLIAQHHKTHTNISRSEFKLMLLLRMRAILYSDNSCVTSKKVDLNVEINHSESDNECRDRFHTDFSCSYMQHKTRTSLNGIKIVQKSTTFELIGIE